MGKFWESGKIEILFFQRELSPSPPSCSEPERLAGKTWSLVGEFFLQYLVLVGEFFLNFNLTTHLGYYLRLNVLGKLTCKGMVGAVCSVGQVRRITLSLSASINVYPKNRRSLPTILEHGPPSGPFLICSSGK